jgi:hypothetical protein
MARGKGDQAVGHELTRIWGMLIGRVQGPFAFRLILQPLAATFFAARGALSDVRAGRPPYGWAVLTSSHGKRELLLEGWKHVAKIFIAAVVIDMIYEVIVFHWIYPVQALIVAAVLALLPYPVIRGLLNRVLRRWHRFHGRHESTGAAEEGSTPNAVAKGPH